MLSAKFQISIPKSVREQQHWQAGQEFVFIPKGRGVLLMPVPDVEEAASRAVRARTRADRFCASSIPRRGPNGGSGQ